MFSLWLAGGSEARWGSRTWRNGRLTDFCHSEGGRRRLAGEQVAVRNSAARVVEVFGGVLVIEGKKVG